jgi:hypothetical protein
VRAVVMHGGGVHGVGTRLVYGVGLGVHGDSVHAVVMHGVNWCMVWGLGVHGAGVHELVYLVIALQGTC